jgi:hypothetical protein
LRLPKLTLRRWFAQYPGALLDHGVAQPSISCIHWLIAVSDSERASTGV